MSDAGTYPSVKHLPISEKRKNFIISRLIREFNENAIGRAAVNVKHVASTDGLLHLGLNSVADKIWFVDYSDGKTAYSYETLGWMEGKSIALSETGIIVRKILDETASAQNTLELDKEITEDALDRGISILERRGLSCDAIVTNVHEFVSFWWFNKFRGKRAEGPSGIRVEGYFGNVPVYWANSIPENTTLLLNKNIGDLLVGKDLSADIREIEEKEVESILNNIKNLKRSDLEEKVQFIADEAIRFDLKRKDASVIIESKRSQDASPTKEKTPS